MTQFAKQETKKRCVTLLLLPKLDNRVRVLNVDVDVYVDVFVRMCMFMFMCMWMWMWMWMCPCVREWASLQHTAYVYLCETCTLPVPAQQFATFFSNSHKNIEID